MREPCQNSALCSNGFGLVIWTNTIILINYMTESRIKLTEDQFNPTDQL